MNASPEESTLRAIRSADELEDQLLLLLASKIGHSVDQLAADEPVQRYGVGSLVLVDIAQELEVVFELELSPTFFWDYPTIRAVAAFLIEQRRERS